jgi:hypothetical protein
MTRHTARLEVQELGERIVPSVTVVAGPAASARVLFAPRLTPITNVSGSGHGSFSIAPTRFGVGPTFLLRATGTITGMGSVGVIGSLHAPALNATGPVTGTLLIRSGQGSITVSLTAPSQSGSSPLPTSFQYQVVASTGLFVGSSASGTMHLTLSRDSHFAPVLSFSF